MLRGYEKIVDETGGWVNSAEIKGWVWDGNWNNGIIDFAYWKIQLKLL